MYEFRAPDKLRPVLVVSRQKTIELLHTVLVAPITSTIRGIDSEVAVGVKEGLKKESAANFDNLRTVEQSQLRRFIGTLSADKLKAVCRAIAVATGCDG